MTTETTPVDDAPEAPDVDEPFDIERARAKIAKQNSENAALRKRLKDAEAAQARLDELEASGKSEVERLREQLEAAERRAQEATTTVLRLEVAGAKGLSPAQARRLVGNTREELEADADELLETFQAKATSPPPTSKPNATVRDGGSGQPLALNGDPLENALKNALGIRTGA